MEGGSSFVAKPDVIQLKDRVKFEIESHEQVKLTNAEIFKLYWFGYGNVMKDRKSFFVKEGISRLQ